MRRFAKLLALTAPLLTSMPAVAQDCQSGKVDIDVDKKSAGPLAGALVRLRRGDAVEHSTTTGGSLSSARSHVVSGSSKLRRRVSRPPIHRGMRPLALDHALCVGIAPAPRAKDLPVDGVPSGARNHDSTGPRGVQSCVDRRSDSPGPPEAC